MNLEKCYLIYYYITVIRLVLLDVKKFALDFSFLQVLTDPKANFVW
jgi:hypothetical protein